MKLITRHTLAASAYARWVEQYRLGDPSRQARQLAKGDAGDKADRLKALGSNPSPGDVDHVVGNNSWTGISCNECGRSVEQVVRLGEEPDYESATAQVCPACLFVALRLVDGE